MTTPAPDAPCPCGSGESFERCCARYIGGEPAPTPEVLMRSRYSAFVVGATDYLLATWHPQSRPASIDADGPHWSGLEIVHADDDGERGTVEFRAHYRDGTRLGTLHETSRFVREQGRWFYLDGDIHPAPAQKVGRNAPCPCGSGKKFKRCCGR